MVDKETVKGFLKPGWKKILLFVTLLFILYFYGCVVLSFFYPSGFFLEKQLYAEGNTVLYVPSSASVSCQKVISGPDDRLEHYIHVYTGLKRLHFAYVCDLSWIREGVNYSITAGSGADLRSYKLLKNSVKIKIVDTGLRLDFDGAYVNKACSLPALKKTDEFLTKNTRLDVYTGDRFVEIPHMDLRDSDENIVSIHWDNYYDFNADGIIDMVFDFNSGYARDSSIPLMYSRTPNRDEIKYVTIHSGKEIDYIINGLYVRTNPSGDIDISHLPSYMQGYAAGECERYFLLAITKPYGIPCDTDWMCRVNYVSHSGRCVNGLCVYPILCKYAGIVSSNDFSEESYCMGPCKYNKPIQCNSFRANEQVNESNLLKHYYDMGLLTSSEGLVLNDSLNA